MIVVDSSIWIDYFNGTTNKKTDWLDDALGLEPIIMGDIILAEVLQGFQSEKDFKTANKAPRALTKVKTPAPPIHWRKSDAKDSIACPCFQDKGLNKAPAEDQTSSDCI